MQLAKGTLLLSGAWALGKESNSLEEGRVNAKWSVHREKLEKASKLSEFGRRHALMRIKDPWTKQKSRRILTSVCTRLKDKFLWVE